MLDKFIYEDHLGRRFVGLENGVYLNYSDLRNYAWDYDTINSRISRFFRPITKRKLPIVICCQSDEEAFNVRNRLLELAETDIEAKKPGKIIIGDYYTNGYIIASSKSNYLINKRLCNIDLTLVSDDPAWYSEQLFVFASVDSDAARVSGGIDYPYDYTYDYLVALTGRTITLDTIGNNAFRLLIYGEVINPSISIGGHVYAINGTVGKGETLLIDSLAKTITLTTAAGNKVNWFDKRSRESYIFEPIPAGQNAVAYSGAFAFELTVIEKRSEPRWT